MLTYLKLLATAAFWGGTFVAGRLLAGVIPPFNAAFLRFAVASALLLVLLYQHLGKLPRLTRRQFGAVLLLGSTGVLGYNVAFFSGLQTVEASRAGLIIALNPVGITLLSALIGGEPLTLPRTLGVVISMTGAILVISRGDIALLTSGIGAGELALFGCVICWSLYSVIGRRAMHELTPLTAVTYSATAGTLLLLPLSLSQNLFEQLGNYPLTAFASIFYLAIFGTVLGFLWYYQAIRTIGAVRSGVFINFVPLFAVLFGVVLLGERLSASLIQGAILVTAGVWFTNHGTRTKLKLPEA